MAVQLPDLFDEAAREAAELPGRKRLGLVFPANWTNSRDVWIPAGALGVIILACFVWPLLFPLPDPTKGQLTEMNLAPFSPHHLLGTDPDGYDILSRLLYGGRISLEVGFGATTLGMLIGGTLGTLSGYWGRTLDVLIMRIFDMFLSFPSLMLALIVATFLGPSEFHSIIAISFFTLPTFARMARSAALQVRDRTYVVAARLSGSRGLRVIAGHILPNVGPQLLTLGFLTVAVAILVEAALSFLGAGVPLPQPSWGNMISAGQPYLATDPLLVLIPTAFLLFTVLALNLLGDAIRNHWPG